MLMRIFLLVLLAATSVSCENVPISGACNTSSTALDNPAVDVAESYINKTGCTKLNFDINYLITCNRNVESGIHNCDNCKSIFSNTSAFESAVNSSSGRICYIDLTISLTGIKADDNKQILVSNKHKNFSFIAVGGDCNQTEIGEALLLPFATESYGYLDSIFSNATGVTWTSGSATLSACGASRKVIKDLNPSSNSGSGSNTTTNTTSGSGSGSDSGSGSSTNSNSTSTSSPTTVSPVTPAPTNISSSSSSSSSTGGKGTGTTGNGNGASVMMHSATAVMVTIISAAVTVIIGAA